MKKLILTILLLVLARFVFADGKVFKGLDYSSMRPVHENEQRAFIAHKNGREAMVLAVNFDIDENEKAFWLFPVLGQPEDIKTDILESYPQLFGYDPIIKAKEKMDIIAIAQLYTQPYLYPVLCCTMWPTLGVKGINIHSEVEKEGLRIQTITGDSLESLTEFLQLNGIVVENSEIKVYEDYLNDKYTLVFVAITSIEELLGNFPELIQRTLYTGGRWPCIFVEFPAEQVFYPLKPTGTYRDILEVNLIVMDYMEPVDKDIQQPWRYDYFSAKILPEDFPKALLPYIDEDNLRYTRMRFMNQASLLKQDLYLAPADVQGMRYAEGILKLSELNGGIFLMIAFFIITIQSWVCAGLSGKVIKKRWNPYANLGFGNLVTLVGVHLAAKYGQGIFGTDLNDERQKSQRSKFLCLFALFFILSSVLLYIILHIPFFF